MVEPVNSKGILTTYGGLAQFIYRQDAVREGTLYNTTLGSSKGVYPVDSGFRVHCRNGKSIGRSPFNGLTTYEKFFLLWKVDFP